MTSYVNAGQICNSTERIYVQRDVLDQFVEELRTISGAYRLGPGSDPGTTMGPLIDDLQLGKVSSQVEDAVKLGATLHCGGHRLDRRGYFYPPTVLTGVTEGMLLMQEETFGPIAPVVPFEDFDEALALANAGRYGLAAIVYTTASVSAFAAIERLEAGMVKINTTRGKAGGATSEPFKASGIGNGYGVELLSEITRQKSIHWRVQL
jgi:acyl-CoA reductase-like NAD-dependent aldehyde dehydrogenase